MRELIGEKREIQLVILSHGKLSRRKHYRYGLARPAKGNR